MSFIPHAVATLGVCIAIAVFICFLTYHNSAQKGPNYDKSDGDVKSIANYLMENIDAERIRSNLRAFTVEPHVAGTPANNHLADKIAAHWRESGIEDVHFIKYDVLLSYPNYSDPNRVTIFDAGTNAEIYKTKGVTPVIIPEEQGVPGAGVQWLAYSPSGTVEGEVVYCHYGSPADFELLKQRGISVKGKIALMRYYRDWRGGKVRNAAENGAVGAILYSDPMEVAKDGVDSVYPDTVYMPSRAVQRGTLKMGEGDPLTPLYPARSDLFPSATVEEVFARQELPSIPAIPMSYADAYQVLSRLGGVEVPVEWRGGLNVTYRFGSGFVDAADKPANWKIRLTVNGEVTVRPIQNIVGYIRGAVEPDEYVILGNHYDAWVYGAIDPISGTATLAEVARALKQTMKETGWRPARTIMFCNWDAEEYGLIGSTEFVEDFVNILNDRAVVYMNVDVIFGNLTFNADTIPILYDVVVGTARKIPNPAKSERDAGRETIFDTWVLTNPDRSRWLPDNYPDLAAPTGSSDHKNFVNYAGVPIVDFRYQNIKVGYPLYHTLYETPFLVERLIDSDHMAVYRAIGQYWAELTRTFADAPILPLSVKTLANKLSLDYVVELREMLDALRNRSVNENDSPLRPTIHQAAKLAINAKDFIAQAEKFDRSIQNLNIHSFTDERAQWHAYSRINRRLRSVERCFINPRGIDGHPYKRHVLFSNSNLNLYATQKMAAVYDAIYHYKLSTTTEQKVSAAREIAFQISIVQNSVLCVIHTLKDLI